ncbi:hypothetical protein J3R30DRAFT_3503450 [Lentinula aciculospora]|uniref:Uncharacterized protein n=1 Tax=Lentinula aciculospora TaxID=153920 RepID=A0A9W9A6S8_9AGAR|nr:hypothetical protein J3R30DRAFT_3503450 [Lentinula aciculospora]
MVCLLHSKSYLFTISVIFMTLYGVLSSPMNYESIAKNGSQIDKCKGCTFLSLLLRSNIQADHQIASITAMWFNSGDQETGSCL